nr:hypothetical protein [Brevundimonas naejangsanensis]
MTKKLLLAAAAAGVMAFAGAASAGTLSNTSSISGVTLASGGKVAPLTIASEATNPVVTSGASSVRTAVGGATIVFEPTSPASVSAGVTNTYEVIFTPSGGKFHGASTVGATTTGTATATFTQLGLLSDGTVAGLVAVSGGATGGTVTGFSVTTGIDAPSETDIKVAYSANLISNGVRIPVDSAAASTVVQFKPVMAANALAASAKAVEAALPNYTSFKAAGNTTATSAELATGIQLKANAATGNADDKFFSSLTVVGGGVTTPAIADLSAIVTGGTLTVTGTAGAQLDKLAPKVGALTPAAATLTDTTAVFTVADGSVLEGAGFPLTLTQPTTAIPVNAANYSVSFVPTFANGFTAPTTAYGPVAAGAVSLEGTNFTAPWFTLNNANNTAFLRLANNGTAATGPVFVTLKAHNGTTAPTTARVKVADSIASNGVFQITGPELATLFGSNAQNGDLQVTIQGDGTVISGKVRVRNATGALSEQSLGTLSGK